MTEKNLFSRRGDRYLGIETAIRKNAASDRKTRVMIALGIIVIIVGVGLIIPVLVAYSKHGHKSAPSSFSVKGDYPVWRGTVLEVSEKSRRGAATVLITKDASGKTESYQQPVNVEYNRCENPLRVNDTVTVYSETLTYPDGTAAFNLIAERFVP